MWSEALLLATYKSLVRSLIDYVPIILITLPVSRLDQIEQLQRNAARIICNTHSRAPTADLFERLHLDSVSSRAAALSTTYWDKALDENILIQELFQAYELNAPVCEGAECRARPRTTIIGRIIELKDH